MFDTLLIANRGEIACRIIRTARRMGIRTVAVYSDADVNALHVALADVAVRIGPAAATDSYLKIGAILDAARATGADAIHPGYGFLSENADFADACIAAGLTFVGPPACAIRAMGGKSEAKALMEAAGVPLVPGYHGEIQDDGLLATEAARIGWPVLIKASAGGGGKGMKVAASADEFIDQLNSARREARASFGYDKVLVERYLARPRHVEIQVFADSHGNYVHLFERDCSIQRRHQKIIEEAPAPNMDSRVREQMGAAAIAAAKAVGYVGAGTVEFLLDSSGSFYFMEMNTRLQVEHPVTEFVTGQDLVEWQLRVAAGEELPLTQEQLSIHGHAIEVRLYAEDPSKDFLPQSGTLAQAYFPAAGPHVRLDSGVRAGDVVSIHYDPMLAKLIVWDNDRPAAVRRLRAALAETQLIGLNTNIGFLSQIAAHPAFMAADLSTQFVERYADDLLEDRQPNPSDLLLATLGLLFERAEQARLAAAESTDPYSPWHRTDGWRLNDEIEEDILWREPGEAGAEHVVKVRFARDGFSIALNGNDHIGGIAIDADGNLVADLDGIKQKIRWNRRGAHVSLFYAGRTANLSVVEPLASAADEAGPIGLLTSPMPGKITALVAPVGAVVKKGQPLLVLEAMKVEHTIRAPAGGTVTAYKYAVGDQVPEGVELLGFEASVS